MVPNLPSNNPLNDITVILHRPAVPENIGSAVRAMRNTGFTKLILSCPETEDWATARKLAVSAADILESAPRCSSLDEAIILSRATCLIGTTGRERKYWQSTTIGSAAPNILSRVQSGGAALIFGPENTGLTNEELTLCHMIVTIPSEQDLTSYNLAQAVLLVLFTLMTNSQPALQPDCSAPAPFDELEGMYTHIEELLTQVGFLLEDNPDHMMRVVRAFINRAQPVESEVKVIRGVCRRLLWHLRNPAS